jgi:hypothetical protein
MGGGFQEVKFDAGSLPSGVYIDRVSAEVPSTDGSRGTSRQIVLGVTKMVLIR